ncbi:unnamed protein product [Litomosoides sigmodontis]|uniref:Uncharacterized protein n=1 Tax=Litomosoides sigmodontis TaxID=42156 RepID=A0A3P6TK77_LITSI|nr:unnamed protein product [Litomosoides sigmodontis]
MPSTPSSSNFYRNLRSLTERNKKRKNESLTNSHSNSDEAVNNYSNVPQPQPQQQRQSVEVSREVQDASLAKRFLIFVYFNEKCLQVWLK